MGRLFDAADRAMIATHATKRTKGADGSRAPARRYRYYVSKVPNGQAATSEPAQRLPAAKIEQLVESEVVGWLRRPAHVLDALAGNTRTAAGDIHAGSDTHAVASSTHAACPAGEGATTGTVRAHEFAAFEAASKAPRTLIERVGVHRDHVRIEIDRAALAELLHHAGGEAAAEGTVADPLRQSNASRTKARHAPIVLTVAATLKRTGMETRFVVAPNGSIDARTNATQIAPDPDLLNALARSHALRDRVMDRPELPLIEIAREHGLNPTKAARLLRLAFLSPRIVTSILNGQQPADLSVRRLLKGEALSMDWTAQEQTLGYSA